MKQIFFRELRAHLKGLIIWSIAMLLTLYMSMGKFDAIRQGGQAIQQMFQSFPPSMQAIFGLSGLDITTVAGYYGILLIYIAIIAAIHAGMLGVDLLSKEERDHTSEFLFPKPIGRGQIVTAKLCAGFVNIAVMNVVVWLSSFGAVSLFAPLHMVIHEISLMVCAVGLIQLVFFFTGAALAAATQAAGRIIAGLVFGGYIIFILISLEPSIDGLRIVSPIAFFNAKDIIASMQLSVAYVLCCVAAIVFATAMTYLAYDERDLRT